MEAIPEKEAGQVTAMLEHEGMTEPSTLDPGSLNRRSPSSRKSPEQTRCPEGV